MKSMRNALWMIIFCMTAVQAQTYIPDGSQVYGIWSAAQSPYIIEGEAVVPADSILRIEAGVEVRFKTGTEADYLNPAFDLGFLRVEGGLTASGTADQPVVFTRDGDSGNWGILYFHSTADSSSLLEYCRIEYASRVLHINDWVEYNGAVSLNENYVTLRNCKIVHNAYDGVFANSAGPLLQNCLLTDNDNGIMATNYCDLQVTNCTIANNRSTGYNAGYNAVSHVINSVFWGNQTSLESNLTSTVSLSFSLLAEEALPAEGVANEGGNITAIDPFFADTASDDYSLRSNSFAINAGTADTSGLGLPAVDAAGTERILYDRIDMGAYEFAGSYLRLTVPNGWESWKIGTTQTIRWQSNVASVDLEYSVDNGQNWLALAGGQPGSGGYDWLIPNELSEQCLVRVSNAADPSLADQSDTTFIISDKTIIPDGKRVFGTWTKEYSPFVVRGEALVPADSLLVIEPGVEVRFATGGNHVYTSPDFDLGMLRVDGRLLAEGTESDSIHFTRDGESGHWGILFLNGGLTDSSILRYTAIEYASYCDSLLDSLGFEGAVSVTGAGLLLEHSRLNQNGGSGIHIDGRSAPRIQSNNISGNGNNGLLFTNADGKNQPVVKNNHIHQNGRDGIAVETITYCQIERNLIENNTRYGIFNSSGYAQTQVVNNRISRNTVGIYCTGLIEITNNLIADNEQGVLLDHLSPQIMNNTIVNNSADGIYCNEASPYVTNCIFSGNANDFDFESGDASAPNVIYSLFSKSFLNPKVVNGGGNRLGQNPAFAGDGEHPYALKSASPAIDSGTMDNALVTLPQTDLAGKPRVYDGNNDGNSVVDMGAYEFSELIADFTADVTIGEKPLAVRFTNESVGEVDSLIWYFGDGDSSIAQNPEHVYSEDGQFTVQLTIFGPLGSSEKIREDYILVENAPRVIHPLPDTSFAEDSGEHFLLYFAEVFTDPDSADTLIYTYQGNNPQISIRRSGDSLFVRAEDNFFGQAEYILTATDPYGLSAADTFVVTIRSVNDAPEILDTLPDTLRFRADSSITLETWRYVTDVETPPKELFYMYGVSNDSILITLKDSTYAIILSADENFRGQSWLYIGVQDDSMATASDSLLVIVEAPLSIETELNDLPVVFELLPNYPNPFNPKTTIRYSVGSIQKSSVRVELSVYDVLGQKVATLFAGKSKPGSYKAVWDAAGYPSGLYIVRFISENGYSKARKIILLK